MVHQFDDHGPKKPYVSRLDHPTYRRWAQVPSIYIQGYEPMNRMVAAPQFKDIFDFNREATRMFWRSIHSVIRANPSYNHYIDSDIRTQAAVFSTAHYWLDELLFLKNPVGQHYLSYCFANRGVHSVIAKVPEEAIGQWMLRMDAVGMPNAADLAKHAYEGTEPPHISYLPLTPQRKLLIVPQSYPHEHLIGLMCLDRNVDVLQRVPIYDDMGDTVTICNEIPIAIEQDVSKRPYLLTT